ncbi:MAG: hypothetical protein ACREJT_18465 [Myxococcota bacterium]
MACCAFAAFVVSQIVFAFLGLRERFLGAPDPERASAIPNLAAAWRAGDPEAIPARARSRVPLRIATAVGAGALAFALTFAVSHASDAESMSTASSTFLCSGGEAR